MNPERVFTVLLEPHFSEKASNAGDQHNQYAFKVAGDATKREIREAVETLFKVSVSKVTTTNVKGKQKRTVRGVRRTKSWKKAYVSVAGGAEIDFMALD